MKKIGKTLDEKQGHNEQRVKEKHLLGQQENGRGVCGGLGTMVLAHTSYLHDCPQFDLTGKQLYTNFCTWNGSLASQ